METLAFYSYKGGAGRSLLLANTARFLASLGRGVVALDLDLEAPGLHYKLGRKTLLDSEPERMGGAVPYLLATAQGATSPPPLEEHMIEVPVPPESGGWLQLMPAGPAPGRVYWTALKELGEQVRFDDPSGQGLLALLDLHARIQEELKPDYLLIDARTGVTELGGLATTLLANTLVCMFVGNQESLDGTLTVAEAVKAAPRLKQRRPVNIVSVLARATSAPPTEGPFAAGVKRLLEIGEGRQSGDKREKQEKPKLFVLPHDEIHGAADRVIGGEKTASAFSPLYKSYLELFRELFPSSAQLAQEALGRLEAVASLKTELTKNRSWQGFAPVLNPWEESAIDEGVVYESERYRPKGSRYADLICRDAANRPLMVVQYVPEDEAEEAKEFWTKSTTVRCLVLLCRKKQGWERHMYSRPPNRSELLATDRREPPLPLEFDLFPDVGHRSAESMLDALRHGHAAALELLISEWRDSMAAVVAVQRIPPWRPTRARQILDGLVGTEDPRLGEHILHQTSSSSLYRWRRRSVDDDWPFTGDLEPWLDKDLFAPLFWRLPVEAVLGYMQYRGTIPCLAGYHLLAEDLMGLDYHTDRSILAEGQTLSLLRPEDERAEDGEDWEPVRWLHRHRERQAEQIQLSEEPPPLLYWEELLRDQYRYGTLEEAQEKLSDKERKRMASPSGLRNRLRDRLNRRELVIGDFLGQYDMTGRLVLFTKVIAGAAELLGVAPRYLKSVVFIHLSVRFLAHQARDLDGQPGYGFAPSPPVSPLNRESPVHVTLAQCFAHRLIQRLEDPNLMAAFEKLSQHQPEAYRQWSSMQAVPLEQLRTLLLRARASAPALGMPATHNLE